MDVPLCDTEEVQSAGEQWHYLEVGVALHFVLKISNVLNTWREEAEEQNRGVIRSLSPEKTCCFMPSPPEGRLGENPGQGGGSCKRVWGRGSRGDLASGMPSNYSAEGSVRSCCPLKMRFWESARKPVWICPVHVSPHQTCVHVD